MIRLLFCLNFFAASMALAQTADQGQLQNQYQDQPSNNGAQMNQPQQYNQGGDDANGRTPSANEAPYPLDQMQQNTQAPNMPVDQN